jgi:hypothetical protein
MKKYIFIFILLVSATISFGQSAIQISIVHKEKMEDRDVLIYKLETVNKQKVDITALTKELFATTGFMDIGMSNPVCSTFTIYINSSNPLKNSTAILNTLKKYNFEISNLLKEGGR